ncbi:MAG: YdeI/OmpD-associated family protein [Moheibacter sp.]
MDKANKWNEELNRLTEIVEKTNLVKTIKWGTPVYTHKGKNIVAFTGFKNHFAIWFYNGVFLSDQKKVLINAQKEKTKALRQWRFTSIDEIDETTILTYIKEAIKNSETGKEFKPTKFKSVPIPDLLQNELNSNTKLKTAFEQLTPGKQKEYNLYINEAKQEKTKLSRIEKIKPLILNGVGLHDKYK